jgi:hypothetical protein
MHAAFFSTHPTHLCSLLTHQGDTVTSARQTATTTIKATGTQAAAAVRTTVQELTEPLPGTASDLVNSTLQPTVEAAAQQLPQVAQGVGQAVLVEGAGQLGDTLVETAVTLNQEVVKPFAEVGVGVSWCNMGTRTAGLRGAIGVMETQT